MSIDLQPKKTKRPSVLPPKPLLIPALAHTNGGTLSKPTNGLRTAAIAHLGLLKKNREMSERSDLAIVYLAHKYGITDAEIASNSGLTVDRVRAIIGGA